MNKQEALERLDALEAEAKKLREIIDAPEFDKSKWIGRYGFYSHNSSTHIDDDGILSKLKDIDDNNMFILAYNSKMKGFRPATLRELGVMEFFKELPAEINFIVIGKYTGAWQAQNVSMSGLCSLIE